jgi:hypothetical protein
MILAILELLPTIIVAVLLGMWVAHILRMWSNCFKRDE